MVRLTSAPRFRASNAFAIFVVSVSIFTEVLLLNLVVPILPFILRERLELDPQHIQTWNSILLAAHGAAMIVGSLTFGWVGDQVSNRGTPFTMSLGLLAIATLCFYVGTSLPVFLLARIFQGLSGAAVFTFGRALLQQKVGQSRMGKAMGWTGTAMSAGLLLGPVAGGWLFELGGSDLVFLLPVGMLVAEMILRFLIRDDKPPLSIVCETAGAETLPNTEAPSRDGSKPKNEDRATETDHRPLNDGDASDLEASPLLPSRAGKRRRPLVTLLLSPRISATLLASLVLNTLANGFDAILPSYCLSEFNARSSQVAIFFLMMGIPMLFSPIAGHLVDRYGTKWPTVGGLAFLIPSLFLLGFVAKGMSHPFVWLGTLLLLVGTGFCQAMPPLQVEISAAVKAIEDRSPEAFGAKGAYTQAFGLLNTAFSIGAMIGPLLTGFLRLTVGWRWTTFVMACLALVVIIIVVLVMGEQRSKAEDLKVEDELMAGPP